MRRPSDDGRRGRSHLIPVNGSVVRRLTASLLCLVVAAGCARATDDGSTGKATAASGPLPSLSGETLGDVRFDRADLTGRVVVVNFWATWCGPCRREQPVLSSVAEETGAAFVGVNYRDDAAAAAAYLEEFGVTYPSLSDPSGTIAYGFGVPYLPATYVADESGELRFRVVGEIDRQTLVDLINEVSNSEG